MKIFKPWENENKNCPLYFQRQNISIRSLYIRVWLARLDDFLKFSGWDIFTHAGKISHEMALDKAHQEFEKYHREKLKAPTPIEKHLAEVVKEIKQLKTGRKRRGKSN